MPSRPDHRSGPQLREQAPRRCSPRRRLISADQPKGPLTLDQASGTLETLAWRRTSALQRVAASISQCDEIGMAQDAFRIYKPLRNYVRRFERESALRTIYNYSMFLDFDHELEPPLQRPGPPVSKIDFGFHQWDLEIALREILLESPTYSYDMLNSWSAFAELINKMRKVDQEIYRAYRAQSDVMLDIFRIAHHQFPWQIGLTNQMMIRYYKIYNRPEFDILFLRSFGLNVLDFFRGGFALIGCALDDFKFRLSDSTTAKNRLEQIAGICAALFSESPANIEKQIRDRQQYNQNWKYTFCDVRTYPLLKIGEEEYLVPLPSLIFYRMTDAVYFDLVGYEAAFSSVIGPAFQAYVGEVVQACMSNDRLHLLPEEKYGPKKRRKDSVDWIVHDDSASLFVECKSSRMGYVSKSEILSAGVLEDEIERLASFVVQCYVTLSHALEGSYPHWKPNGRPTYVLIVSLDEWFAFGYRIYPKIVDRVQQKLREIRTADNIVNECPFQLCSISEFEVMMQCIDHSSMEAFFSQKTQGEQRSHLFRGFSEDYLRAHGRERTFLFQTDHEGLFAEEALREIHGLAPQPL